MKSLLEYHLFCVRFLFPRPVAVTALVESTMIDVGISASCGKAAAGRHTTMKDIIRSAERVQCAA